VAFTNVRVLSAPVPLDRFPSCTRVLFNWKRRRRYTLLRRFSVSLRFRFLAIKNARWKLWRHYFVASCRTFTKAFRVCLSILRSEIVFPLLFLNNDFFFFYSTLTRLSCFFGFLSKYGPFRIWSLFEATAGRINRDTRVWRIKTERRRIYETRVK